MDFDWFSCISCFAQAFKCLLCFYYLVFIFSLVLALFLLFGIHFFFSLINFTISVKRRMFRFSVWPPTQYCRVKKCLCIWSKKVPQSLELWCYELEDFESVPIKNLHIFIPQTGKHVFDLCCWDSIFPIRDLK